ncbi:hypothetical protein EMIHUDRAFT_447051, partial [Emiliania huxleyi CCMP1516]|uniref:Uncharacterized protein n=2 Tax=Emiliania huxleyi TaxID=2903 RepID=A0A0D3JA91_EMIH1
SPLHSRAVVAAGYNPGENPAELSAALGGLKPGTGRPLNALIKLRAETGVERVDTSSSPLFKPGAVLDTVRTADGRVRVSRRVDAGGRPKSRREGRAAVRLCFPPRRRAARRSGVRVASRQLLPRPPLRPSGQVRPVRAGGGPKGAFLHTHRAHPPQRAQAAVPPHGAQICAALVQRKHCRAARAPLRHRRRGQRLCDGVWLAGDEVQGGQGGSARGPRVISRHRVEQRAKRHQRLINLRNASSYS